MSESVKVKCPVCGRRVEIDVVSLIKNDDAVHLRELFSGKLNCVACPGCGQRLVAPCNLVFRDAEKPFIMYELPPSDDIPVEELELKVDEMATEVFAREGLPRPVVRITFNRTDFIEKIAARRLGYDDRLLEFAKLQLFRTMEEPQLLQSRHRLLLDYSHCNEETLAFLVYDIEEAHFVNTLHVPMEEFKSLVYEYEHSKDVQLELETAFPGCYVSADRLL